LEEKKIAEDAKKEVDKALESRKTDAEQSSQRILELEADLREAKMESALSFYNGFEWKKSQMEFLHPDVDLSQLNSFKTVQGGDLVDEAPRKITIYTEHTYTKEI